MSRIGKLRRIPWVLLFESVWAMRSMWVALPRRDREELVRLMKKSKGLPQNLTAHERGEFRRIALDLDFKTVAFKMAPITRKLRKR